MIEQFREIWHCDGGPAASLPHGARGKVAQWSLERVSDLLRHFGRGNFRAAFPGDRLTPHEIALETVYDNLARGDQAMARTHAQWLVPGQHIDRLLRALAPVATGPGRLRNAA